MPDDLMTRRVEAVALAMENAEFGYSMELVRLVDNVSTYRLALSDGETLEFDNTDDCYEHIRHKKRLTQARAAIDAADASLSQGVTAVLRNFQITGPDADGLVWLVLHGHGTTGKGLVQIGGKDRLISQVALKLEEDRRSALGSCLAADAVGPGEAEGREACLRIVKATYEQWERDYEGEWQTPYFWVGAEEIFDRIVDALAAPSPEQG